MAASLMTILLSPLSFTATTAPLPVSRTPALSRPVIMKEAGKFSASLPFLSQPEALKGTMVGDVGFDPLGLSNIDGEYINLAWMREAEIKHGRVAMLATLGWIAVDIGFKLPGDKYAGLTSLNAHAPMVAAGDLGFMLFIVALVEAKWGAKFFEPGHVPGNYGWDPLEMGKGDSEAAIKELKNGRLAMLAFSGIVTQAALTGKGLPYF